MGSAHDCGGPVDFVLKVGVVVVVLIMGHTYHFCNTERFVVKGVGEVCWDEGTARATANHSLKLSPIAVLLL